MEYRHTQQAIMPFVAWILFIIILYAIVPNEEIAPWVIGFVVVITGVMLVFSRLTVTVTNDAAITAFGVGWPRHTVQMAKVTSATAVRNRWIHGWGIRKIAGGWMYNVSGYDAVELDLTSGKKFRIGTDEPDALEATLNLVIRPQD